MIFFTSDTHFGSNRTLDFSKRPFRTINEMDAYMVKNWNNTVKQDDMVYHLGDFGNYEIAKKLNGRIKLLFGDYEHEDMKHGKISIYELKKYFYTINIENSEYFYYDENEVWNLCHEPFHYHHSYKFNLFGHIHKLQMIKKYGLNVGTDCHNFTPISIEDVLFYKNVYINKILTI